MSNCLECGHVGRLHGGPTGACQSPGCKCGVSATPMKSSFML